MMQFKELFDFLARDGKYVDQGNFLKNDPEEAEK